MIKLEFDNKKLQIDMNDLQNIIKIVENKPEIKSYNRTSDYQHRFNTGIIEEE
jgi:hypothetical protein